MSLCHQLFIPVNSLPVTLPRAKRQSFPPAPTTSLAKVKAHVLQELANHCQLLGSGVSASIATCQSPQGHCGRLCWQGGANPIPDTARTVQELRLFQKQRIRGHTWWCCEGHHPIVGKSTSFKLHPLFPSLHFHFPLLRKRRESCN